jgi:acylphosphatase
VGLSFSDAGAEAATATFICTLQGGEAVHGLGHPVVTVRCRVLVSGRVQGVWFRGTCARRATQAGLAGWARNLADGRVEAVFEGEREAVEVLLAWCREGPSGATVTGVEIIDEEPLGDSGFQVR